MNNLIRHKEAILIFLVILAAILLYAELLQENIIQNFISNDSNEKIIEFTSTLLTLIIVIVGSVFAYFKFFKGHLFLAKLNVKASAQLIKIDKRQNLHIITIKVTNYGQYSIFNPSIICFYSDWPFDHTSKEIGRIYGQNLDNFSVAEIMDEAGPLRRNGKKGDLIYRPGGESCMVIYNKVESTVAASFYRIEVSKKKRVWYDEIVIDNESILEPDEQNSKSDSKNTSSDRAK